MSVANHKELSSHYLVTSHTDHVGPGTIFVAIKGDALDGITFIPLALEKGAKKIIVAADVVLSDEVINLIAAHGACLERVENTRKALAELSAEAYGHPARKLTCIGVTGTKGKTTTCFIIAHLLREAGYKVAVTTTVHNMINQTIYSTNLTTRQPDYLHMFFAACVSEGVEYCIIESAAQAFSLYRLHGIAFDAVVMTNFEQEHGEFYPSLEDYFAAKTQLFLQRKSDAFALINIDDVWCRRLASLPRVQSMSMHSSHVDWYASLIMTSPLCINVLHGTQTRQITTSLVGAFNAYNCLAAYAVAAWCGVSSEQLKKAFAHIPAIPGRMEEYQLPSGARCYVDYAHTPSSYQSVLSTLRQTADHLIVVFGCGGSRDSIKRPLMGAIAAQYADEIILTADNPRYEDPLAIIAMIQSGVPVQDQQKIMIEVDREKAIRLACSRAGSQTVIAVLGKGPDHFQKIKGETLYFNDSEVVRSCINASSG